jgi:hypothetical protein
MAGGTALGVVTAFAAGALGVTGCSSTALTTGAIDSGRDNVDVALHADAAVEAVVDHPVDVVAPSDAGGVDTAPDAGGSAVSVPLMPDLTGWIDRRATGSTAIQGPWYAYADGEGADGMTATGICERAGHPASACSHVTRPMFGSFLNTAGKMCTSGVAAAVVNTADGGAIPDYPNITGAGIALDLNTPTTGGATAAYDASAHGVIGFGFDIDVLPSSGLRVGLLTPATAADPAFWGGNDMISPVKVGHNEFRLEEVLGPFYLINPPSFDRTKILTLRFHVPTSTASSTSYAFCVSNLVALVL